MNIAIVGASGAVGQEFLRVLETAPVDIDELRLFGSGRSAGRTYTFRGRETSPVRVLRHEPADFDGIDFAFVSAGGDVSREFADVITARGALMIDNSSAFRLDPDVPLVIPEINPQDVALNQGIIANPNCATIIGLVCVAPLAAAAGVTRIICSTYQAASGAGLPGMEELQTENQAIVEGMPMPKPRAFAYQLAYNLIPQIGGFDGAGYTSEEMKMQNEGRKIMHDPNLRVNCTCVRVPVARSHSESITVELERPLTPAEAREILAAAPGVKVVDDPGTQQYPMPLETTDQDLVYVGRIREDLSAAPGTHGLTFWCCGDQIRKGAATNAVQIAELLLDL